MYVHFRKNTLKNTKLIKLLKTFKPAEHKRFMDFVRSPYYNKNKNVIRLNESLAKFYPGYDDKKLDEQTLYKQVFGKEKYDYFKLKNVISDLFNLGIEYLKLKPNLYTNFYKEFNILVQLRSRKLLGFHKRAVETLTARFEEVEIKDSFFLYDNYLLKMEYHLSNILQKPNSIQMIQDEFNSFYEFSMLNLLRFYNSLLHIRKENNVKLDMKMLDEVIRYIESADFSNNLSIISYKYLVLLAAKRDEKYYFFLKNFFFKHYKKINYEDAYYTIMYLTGYCTDRYNIDGDRRFIKESCDLLTHSYLNNMVTLGELLYPDFIHYVKVFTRAGKIELAENFISDYKNKLPEELIESCENLANTYISFSKKNYSEALKHVSMVNLPWVIMKIQVRIIQLQLKYHLGYFEEIRSLIEGFKKSLAKEVSVSSVYRDSIHGFLKYLIKLINVIELTDTKQKLNEKEILLKEISESQPNHFGIRFWLEDRLKDIK